MPQWSQVFRRRHDRGLGKQCLQTQIRLSEQSVYQTERPGQTTFNSQEQSDQGLHNLPVCLHLLDALLYVKIMFKF